MGGVGLDKTPGQGKRWKFRGDGVIGPPVWGSREKTPPERCWEHLLSLEKGAANCLAGVGRNAQGNGGHSDAASGCIWQLGASLPSFGFPSPLLLFLAPLLNYLVFYDSPLWFL